MCPCRSHSHIKLDAFDSTPSPSCIAELPTGCLCVYCVHTVCVYSTYLCVNVPVCIHVHMCTYNTYVPVCQSVCVFVYMYTMHVCACVCMCVPESALWHGCYIRTYIHVKATMVSKTVVVIFSTLSGACTQIRTSVR